MFSIYTHQIDLSILKIKTGDKYKRKAAASIAPEGDEAAGTMLMLVSADPFPWRRSATRHSCRLAGVGGVGPVDDRLDGGDDAGARGRNKADGMIGAPVQHRADGGMRLPDKTGTGVLPPGVNETVHDCH